MEHEPNGSTDKPELETLDVFQGLGMTQHHLRCAATFFKVLRDIGERQSRILLALMLLLSGSLVIHSMATEVGGIQSFAAVIQPFVVWIGVAVAVISLAAHQYAIHRVEKALSKQGLPQRALVVVLRQGRWISFYTMFGLHHLMRKQANTQ